MEIHRVNICKYHNTFLSFWRVLFLFFGEYYTTYSTNTVSNGGNVGKKYIAGISPGTRKSPPLIGYGKNIIYEDMCGEFLQRFTGDPTKVWNPGIRRNHHGDSLKSMLVIQSMTNRAPCILRPIRTYYPLVNQHRPWQIGVGRLVSIKNWWFSGSMFIFQRVYNIYIYYSI